MSITPVSAYGTAKFIVSSVAGQGTHTTIATAITAASSGDTIFLRPGSYTENLTLKAGVDLVSFDGEGFTPNVTIIGTCTLTAAGSVTISAIRLQTNSAALLAVTGNSASIVNLIGCYLNCTNNTGITFSTSSGSAQINIINCQGDLGTTGIALFAHSSSGLLNFRNNIIFTNTGASTTASTASAGTLDIKYSPFAFPITTSSTNVMAAQYCNFDSAAQNATALTLGGTTHSILNSVFQSGSASAVSISTACTLTNCSVISSNTNAITGGGTLAYSGISFFGTSSKINTTTLTPKNTDTGGISFDGGTNTLSTFTDWTSWTPTITGSSVAGTTTYVTQFGTYCRIGNMVIAQFNLVISAATGTGNATIGGLPFTISNTSNYVPNAACYVTGLTFPALATEAFIQGTLNTTTGVLIASGGAGTAATIPLSNTAGTFIATLTYRV